MNKPVTFHYDLMNAMIVGSKSAFEKANRGYGEVYEELMRMKKEHPDFGYQVSERKSSGKSKNTYKGLTRKLVIEYISIQPDKEILTKEFEKAESLAAGKWPGVKKWFLAKYPEFNVEAAKEAIIQAAAAKTAAPTENGELHSIKSENQAA